jgi:hypothetical protein
MNYQSKQELGQNTEKNKNMYGVRNEPADIPCRSD